MSKLLEGFYSVMSIITFLISYYFTHSIFLGIFHAIIWPFYLVHMTITHQLTRELLPQIFTFYFG